MSGRWLRRRRRQRPHLDLLLGRELLPKPADVGGRLYPLPLGSSGHAVRVERGGLLGRQHRRRHEHGRAVREEHRRRPRGHGVDRPSWRPQCGRGPHRRGLAARGVGVGHGRVVAVWSWGQGWFGATCRRSGYWFGWVHGPDADIMRCPPQRLPRSGKAGCDCRLLRPNIGSRAGRGRGAGYCIGLKGAVRGHVRGGRGGGGLGIYRLNKTAVFWLLFQQVSPTSRRTHSFNTVASRRRFTARVTGRRRTISRRGRG